MENKPSLWAPCFFGITLKQGTQLIALIHIALNTLVFIILTIYMLTLANAVSEIDLPEESELNGLTGLLITVWVVIGILVLLSIGIHVVLLKGATQRSATKLKIYLIICVILLVLLMICNLMRYFSFGMFIASVLGELPFCYQLWVVFCYWKEITSAPPEEKVQYQNNDV